MTLSYRKKNIWRKGINNSKKKNKDRVLNKFFYLYESSPFKCIDEDCTKMLAYILEEYELLEQHTHFAANQLIHIYVVELDGYGSIYSFFSKVMSQKFITSCWNESVYYRYSSSLVPYICQKMHCLLVCYLISAVPEEASDALSLSYIAL